jgi:PAS domain S-box-containing protein
MTIMGKTLRALHIEDSEKDMALITRYLKRAGYDLISDRVETAETMKAALESREWDVILCDYSMPQFSALSALALVKEMKLDIPFMIISGTIGEEAAVEAMRAGAHDYLMKDALTRLIPAIERELSEAGNRLARRQAEDQLRLQSAALESAANGIVITDANGKIIWVNLAFTQSSGYSSEEVVGKNPRLLKSGKQDKVFYDEMWSTILSGNVWRDTIINRRKDGTLYHEDLTITPIRNSSGIITRFVGIQHDITERKLAEEAQQASELRYRRLFESAKDGILILDADTGEIVDANPYIGETLGYSHEELIGKELWQIGVFKDITAARDSFEELRDKGFVRYDDLPLETRTGSVIEVEFVSNVYLVGDSKVMQCNIRNITERRRAERGIEETNRKLAATLAELSATTQQLWQASKLATMGELSASIAHELNNPLATVALRVENLLMPMSESDPQRRSLEIIAQEVDRMAGLIDNLLKFSRRGHRQDSTVDLREEVDNSVEFVHYHLRTRNIEVVREFADALPTVQADRQQLRQLFLNLLTNAADAMAEGGKLTVRAELTRLEGAEAVAIEFADTGEGIAAENLEKIWEPFFTTKPEGKGTGLGLAICRRIVEEPGGTIDIESQAGGGTTVRMVFAATTNGALADSQ